MCRRPHLTTCLGKLMEGVQRNLEPKNRDKFTQVRRHSCGFLVCGAACRDFLLFVVF
jgi:hypothetical protein